MHIRELPVIQRCALHSRLSDDVDNHVSGIYPLGRALVPSVLGRPSRTLSGGRQSACICVKQILPLSA